MVRLEAGAAEVDELHLHARVGLDDDVLGLFLVKSCVGWCVWAMHAPTTIMPKQRIQQALARPHLFHFVHWALCKPLIKALDWLP